jgi:hypothetical protein
MSQNENGFKTGNTRWDKIQCADSFQKTTNEFIISVLEDRRTNERKQNPLSFPAEKAVLITSVNNSF